MTSIWSNRGKNDDDITIYRQDYYTQQQREGASIRSEIDALGAKIRKLRGLKSRTRPQEKLCNELEGELANRYGLFIPSGTDGYAPTFRSFAQAGEEQPWKRLEAIEKEQEKVEQQKHRQTSLARLAEYMDATDFAVLFDEEASWILRRCAGEIKVKEFHTLVDQWHLAHEEDKPIRFQQSIDSKRRAQLLLERFWALLQSHAGLIKDSATEPIRIENTRADFEVVLHMLNKK